MTLTLGQSLSAALSRWLGLAELEPPAHAPEQLLNDIRTSLRAGDVATATQLLRMCGDVADEDPQCLNLRGLLAEKRGDWPLARALWIRAARSSPRRSAAARHNLRRYYELFQWGRCRDVAALGDEPDVVLTAFNEASS